ncbi:MAG: pyridoxal 5'-phosphate synthase glutaminase subunit PdxT [Candidatus Poseidoniaceae archaeon]
MLTVGVAMLQGARNEHMYSLRKAAQNLDIQISIRELRKSIDVDGVDAIVLPGGESTAMKIASRSENLYNEIWSKVKNDSIPTLGTCAGAILLSQQGLIGTEIERNAFGRQKDSFQSEIRVNVGDNEKFQGVFIRAPRFLKGSDHPIAWLGEEVVGVLEGRIMALTFHPELTEDYRFHEWLLSEANNVN